MAALQPDVIHEHEVDSQVHDRGCGGGGGHHQGLDAEEGEAQVACGELVGYVDDWAYPTAMEILTKSSSPKY